MNSGIYKITFMGKEYVGSAKDVKKRINRHLSELRNNRHHNQKLQNEFNKHKADALDYMILEEVDIDHLIEREQYYIDTINPYYNICRTAGSTLGVLHSEEMKAYFSKIRKGWQVSRGRVLSQETKDKIAEKATGRKLHPNFVAASIKANTGRKHTKDEKIKVALKQMKIHINDIDVIRTRFRNGERQADIAIEYGVSQTVISKVCTGKGIYGELFSPEEIYKPQQQGLDFEDKE